MNIEKRKEISPMGQKGNNYDGPFPASVFPPSIFPRRIFPWMGGDDEDDIKINDEAADGTPEEDD